MRRGAAFILGSNRILPKSGMPALLHSLPGAGHFLATVLDSPDLKP
jgi:hypothetical protein